MSDAKALFAQAQSYHRAVHSYSKPQIRMGIPAAFKLVRSISDESTARYLCLTGDGRQCR